MIKSRFAGLAAFAVGLGIVVAGAEGSGAFAQESDTAPTPRAELTDETVPLLVAEPVFVAEEVVQPLPVSQATSSSTAIARGEGSLRATPASGDLSAEMECLAGAVYFEARGEPLDGQLAVAQVVINRTQSRLFPSSYCAVVHQPRQFSFVKRGRMPAVARDSHAWRNARAIARIAHEGLWESRAGEALYFHASYVRPGWANRKQALATIDTHVFYR